MTFALLTLLACFPEIKESEEERFPENPTDDYDQDGFMDAEDCDDTNPLITLEVRYYADVDGDGFGSESDSVLSCPADKPDGYIEEKVLGTEVAFDCNDSDSLIHPVADEICDFVDNDCDQDVDEDVSDAPLWYLDNDGDGYGDFEYSITACADENNLGPERYVSNFADCDDENELIYPNAEEFCNESDDNCNGLIDEPLASDASIWYRDADEDGFGDLRDFQPSCTQPEGYILDYSDCDDANGDVNPNGIELCNEIDDDCDQLTDEGVNSLAPSDASTFYEDFDGDGYGNVLASTFQCNQPTGFVENSDDCDDQTSTVFPGATEYCNNLDDDCDSTIDENDAVDKTAYYEDADGDGFGDASSIEYTCPYNQPSGFVDNLDDCDDTLVTVYPNAQEYCNEIDDNCNGGVDEGTDFNAPPDAVTWYYDFDGDGYGNLTNTILACDSVVGTVSNSDDCDDSRAASRPGAAEYCNELDDDCDGAVDEDAIDRYDYYLDADGDGHGDVTTQVLECPDYSTGLPNPPPNTSEDGDDCDDSNADISPSAAELCTPLIDENCDGDTTYGVVSTDLPSWYPDSDGDGYGNSSFVIQLCEQPLNYVDNADDCNDTDEWVHPENDFLHMNDGVNFTIDDGSGLCQGCVYVDHRELCNGQLDLCENDWNADLSPPTNELDDDGDGRVECTLDVNPLQWADVTLGVVGGDDCDDNDIHAYPDAPELCNGAFEDCNDSLYIAQSQSAPDDELDDDGDCFVECYGFDSNTWEGGIHSCEHVDGIGQMVQETVVVGGEDCNDGNPDTYVGAAYNDPIVCAQDADGDGDADCNLVGLVASTTYSCDFGVDLPNGGMGPDFVLIQGGLEPLGRYTLTNDFYVMTTEVTQQMWTDVMNGSGHGRIPRWDHGLGYLYPANDINWYDAIAFANALSTLTGREECYANTDDPNIDFGQDYDPDELSTNFTTPYECTGFRLLTEAEWEYAARSGTTFDFWTLDGGGTYSSSSCTGEETIQDGVSNPFLRDYAWYCGNNENQYGVGGHKEVGQKLPNGFGLYDIHGNVSEWTADGDSWQNYPQSATDPYNSSSQVLYMVKRGGFSSDLPPTVGSSQLLRDPRSANTTDNGFRIGLTGP